MKWFLLFTVMVFSSLALFGCNSGGDSDDTADDDDSIVASYDADNTKDAKSGIVASRDENGSWAVGAALQRDGKVTRFAAATSAPFVVVDIVDSQGNRLSSVKPISVTRNSTPMYICDYYTDPDVDFLRGWEIDSVPCASTTTTTIAPATTTTQPPATTTTQPPATTTTTTVAPATTTTQPPATTTTTTVAPATTTTQPPATTTTTVIPATTTTTTMPPVATDSSMLDDGAFIRFTPGWTSSGVNGTLRNFMVAGITRQNLANATVDIFVDGIGFANPSANIYLATDAETKIPIPVDADQINIVIMQDNGDGTRTQIWGDVSSTWELTNLTAIGDWFVRGAFYSDGVCYNEADLPAGQLYGQIGIDPVIGVSYETLVLATRQNNQVCYGYYAPVP